MLPAVSPWQARAWHAPMQHARAARCVLRCDQALRRRLLLLAACRPHLWPIARALPLLHRSRRLRIWRRQLQPRLLGLAQLHAAVRCRQQHQTKAQAAAQGCQACGGRNACTRHAEGTTVVCAACTTGQVQRGQRPLQQCACGAVQQQVRANGQRTCSACSRPHLQRRALQAWRPPTASRGQTRATPPAPRQQPARARRCAPLAAAPPSGWAAARCAACVWS